MKKFLIVGLVMSVFAGNAFASNVSSGAGETYCTTDSNCPVGSKCIAATGRCDQNGLIKNPIKTRPKSAK
jgi:hypothetical protein